MFFVVEVSIVFDLEFAIGGDFEYAEIIAAGD